MIHPGDYSVNNMILSNRRFLDQTTCTAIRDPSHTSGRRYIGNTLVPVDNRFDQGRLSAFTVYRMVDYLTSLVHTVYSDAKFRLDSQGTELETVCVGHW